MSSSIRAAAGVRRLHTCPPGSVSGGFPGSRRSSGANRGVGRSSGKGCRARAGKRGVAASIVLFDRDHGLIRGTHRAERPTRTVQKTPSDHVDVKEVQQTAGGDARGGRLERHSSAQRVTRKETKQRALDWRLIELEIGIPARIPVLTIEPFVDPLQVLIDQIVLELLDPAIDGLGLAMPAVDVADPLLVHQPDDPRGIKAAVAEPMAPEMKAAPDPESAHVGGDRADPPGDLAGKVEPARSSASRIRTHRWRVGTWSSAQLRCVPKAHRRRAGGSGRRARDRSVRCRGSSRSRPRSHRRTRSGCRGSGAGAILPLSVKMTTSETARAAHRGRGPPLIPQPWPSRSPIRPNADAPHDAP